MNRLDGNDAKIAKNPKIWCLGTSAGAPPTPLDGAQDLMVEWRTDGQFYS